MGFQKAVKSKAKLRAALFGPSGAGKTYSALSIATGMAGTSGRIAFIDSERGSASKYADKFTFDVVDLDEKNIDEYVHNIEEAARDGYDVLVIDSLSHAWQELVESIDKLAQAKYRGNTWSAWSEGTPKQRKLVNAILSYPGHVLATMRSKTEWQTSKDDRGKNTPQRVGLAPEQGKGIEYEFDLLLELSPEHLAHIIKDRTGKYQDQVIEKPGKAFGMDLVAWLNSGSAEATPAKKPASKAQGERAQGEDPRAACLALAGKLGISTAELGKIKTEVGGDYAAVLEELKRREATSPQPQQYGEPTL